MTLYGAQLLGQSLCKTDVLLCTCYFNWTKK